MDASAARRATNAGKHAKVTEAERARLTLKREITKAIKNGKAQGKTDMPLVYKTIEGACDAGLAKTSYIAGVYRKDGGPNAAHVEAVGSTIVEYLIKQGFEAETHTEYDDTWDPDCGDMSSYTVYVYINWEKQNG